MIQNWIRLPLEGAHNVRELGGLPAMEGRQIAWHHFLRAAAAKTVELQGGN